MSSGWIHRLNARVADSAFGRWFRLDGSGHPKSRAGSLFTTELRAGLTTFAAMSYIISVNAIILSDTGGTCVCNSTPDDPICENNADYNACKNEVRRDLVTATAAVSSLASFLMGALANLPVALAPGMGLNAYFAYSVVGFNGTGPMGISYREALAAVFMEGWLFFVLSLLGVRQWLARLIPRSLTLATGAGIGLFIAFIGLQPSSGLGVIGGDYSNLVGLGGCKAEDTDPEHSYYCLSHVLQNPSMWLGIFVGGIVTVWLMLYRVRGSIIIGILLVSIISWPRPTPVTFFPHTPEGDSNFDFFKKVVDFRRLKYTGNAADFNYGRGKIWFALITFLYVDLMDTTGTLYAMAKFAGVMDPMTLDFERSTVAYMVDAFSISMGALMGSSPVTAFVESSTGIAEGGRTGITGMTAGVCFFISIFFAPIFSSIPSWATGSALVIAGSLMMRNCADINWLYLGDAIPAFLTIIIIPLTYNIAYGLIAGILSMVLVKVLPNLLWRASKGRIAPHNYEAADEWVIPPGGLVPFWMRNVGQGRLPWAEAEEQYVEDFEEEPAPMRPATKGSSEGDYDEKSAKGVRTHVAESEA